MNGRDVEERFTLDFTIVVFQGVVTITQVSVVQMLPANRAHPYTSVMVTPDLATAVLFPS